MPARTDRDDLADFGTASRLFAALFALFTGVATVVVAVNVSGGGVGAAALAGVGQPPDAPVVPGGPATGAPAPPANPALVAGDILVVEIEMTEFAYSPSHVEVPVGVPVTFRVTNAGLVDHEVVIGDAHVQDEAEKAMASAGGHALHRAKHSHGTPSVYLAGGQSGEVTAVFGEPADLLIGCHVAGHWAAGMRGTLAVRPLPA